MTATDLAGMRQVVHCMGTVFTIEVRDCGFDEEAVDEVLRWLHWVDTTFSTYQPDSQISRLGRGELTVAQCAPQVREVLQLCDRLHDVSFGYFSGYATGTLDPSGAVKGWAIEQASELLRSAGSDNHCINGGGDVQCAGRQYAPGQPWQSASRIRCGPATWQARSWGQTSPSRPPEQPSAASTSLIRTPVSTPRRWRA